MGYACPVCDIPHQDGEHLANHLAFTAILHGNDHETWLDEHVPDWESSSPAALADAVTPLASETEFHAVFEDTTDTAHEHPTGTPPIDEFDAETREIIRTARELTNDRHPNTRDDTDPDHV